MSLMEIKSLLIHLTTIQLPENYKKHRGPSKYDIKTTWWCIFTHKQYVKTYYNIKTTYWLWLNINSSHQIFDWVKSTPVWFIDHLRQHNCQKNILNIKYHPEIGIMSPEKVKSFSETAVRFSLLVCDELGQ